MKAVIVLAAVCAVALAQSNLVRHEVTNLLAADHTLTVDQCTAKCDAAFDLVFEHDEQSTDQACLHECTNQVAALLKTTHAPRTHAPTTDAPATDAPDIVTNAEP